MAATNKETLPSSSSSSCCAKVLAENQLLRHALHRERERRQFVDHAYKELLQSYEKLVGLKRILASSSLSSTSSEGRRPQHVSQKIGATSAVPKQQLPQRSKSPNIHSSPSHVNVPLVSNKRTPVKSTGASQRRLGGRGEGENRREEGDTTPRAWSKAKTANLTLHPPRRLESGARGENEENDVVMLTSDGAVSSSNRIPFRDRANNNNNNCPNNNSNADIFGLGKGTTYEGRQLKRRVVEQPKQLSASPQRQQRNFNNNEKFSIEKVIYGGQQQQLKQRMEHTQQPLMPSPRSPRMGNANVRRPVVPTPLPTEHTPSGFRGNNSCCSFFVPFDENWRRFNNDWARRHLQTLLGRSEKRCRAIADASRRRAPMAANRRAVAVDLVMGKRPLDDEALRILHTDSSCISAFPALMRQMRTASRRSAENSLSRQKLEMERRKLLEHSTNRILSHASANIAKMIANTSRCMPTTF